MYQVFVAEPKDPALDKDLLKTFIKSYLTQDELDLLNKILTNLPHIRPFWGDTHYKYIVIDNTKTQQKTMKKWLDDLAFYKPHKILPT